MHNLKWSSKNESCCEKTCLWDLRPGKTQTALLSYKNQLEFGNFGSGKFKYYTMWALTNYKGTGQTAWMCRLICTFVVRIQHNTGFLKTWMKCSGKNHPKYNSFSKYTVLTKKVSCIAEYKNLYGCEVRIEISVTRVTVRHHETCRVMPNIYPNDGIFNSHRRTIMDSFSWIHFLRKLYLNFHMHCYINTTLKYLYFRSRHDRFGFYLRHWRWNVWRKMMSKSDVMMSNWHPDIMHKCCLTPLPPSIPPRVIKFPSPGHVQVGFARKTYFQTFLTI